MNFYSYYHDMTLANVGASNMLYRAAPSLALTKRPSVHRRNARLYTLNTSYCVMPLSILKHPLASSPQPLVPSSATHFPSSLSTSPPSYPHNPTTPHSAS